MTQNKKFMITRQLLSIAAPKVFSQTDRFSNYCGESSFYHVTFRYSPLKSVSIVRVKGGSLHSKGFGNSLNIGAIRI